jgi:hypothetical protein
VNVIAKRSLIISTISRPILEYEGEKTSRSDFTMTSTSPNNLTQKRSENQKAKFSQP